MTAETSLYCPECGEPITAAQLATEGVCPACLGKAEEDIPDLREVAIPPGTGAASPQAGEALPDSPLDPTPSGDEPDPAPGPDDGGEAVAEAAPEQEEFDPLVSLLTLTVSAVSTADIARGLLVAIEGDEFCNAFGNYLDDVVVAGERLLDNYAPGWRAQVGEGSE